MAITEFRPQDQNPAQAPILGEQSGTFGANAQQRRNINQQGNSGRFTNLQQYVQANEANNPNAQLLQREAQARQGELGTKQTQFVSQATPIKTGFETIRSGQQFVQNALENPTQYVTPERLQQFAGYRTSGVGDIEIPYNQLQSLRSGLGAQQEQLASGLETIKSTPTALQNYIQSQRANPSLATRGENVLDRFLTQSTQSGQQAIEGLGTAASAIRQAQAPSIVGDIESLRTQAQAGPVSSSDIRNLITQKTTPEEEYIRNLNNLYVAQQVGIGAPSSGERLRFNDITKVLETPDMTYVRPENLGTATEDLLNQAKIQTERYDKFQQDLAQIEGIKQLRLNRIAEIEAMSRNPASLLTDQINYRLEADRLRGDLDTLDKQKNQLLLKNNGIGTNAIPIYREYLNKLGKTKEQLLSEYDPTRLSRIQALQQLAGTNQFNPLLQTRLA